MSYSHRDIDSDSLGHAVLRGIDLDVFKLPFAIDMHLYAIYKANCAFTPITGPERNL